MSLLQEWVFVTLSPPTLMVNDSVSEYPIYFMTNCKNFFSTYNLLVTANIQLAQLDHISMY